MTAQEKTEEFRQDYDRIRQEVGRIIVGHEAIVEGVLTGILAGGHILLEGVPGLGKTLLVRTLGQALDLQFTRIQFTPDLMPADIIGTNVIVEVPGGGREFRFQRGPVFANLLLADEINRATPKTQSALLEAMQEGSVTVSGTTYTLDRPFFVLATQNPLEMEGTYPLPEAQLDRFLLKLLVEYSSLEELSEIVHRTTTGVMVEVKKVIDGEKVLMWQQLVREVVVAPHVRDYVSRLVLATHPEGPYAASATNRYVRYGSSPRGAQALVLGAKIKALLDSRYNVAFRDVAAVLKPALRHRLILNFEGEAEGVTPDAVLDGVLSHVPEEREAVLS